MRAGHYSDIVLRARRPDSQRRLLARNGLSGQGKSGGAPAGTNAAVSAVGGLVVVESEGAVFDIPGIRVEHSYIPAFIEHFGYSADPGVCAEIWRFVALRSRLRGLGAFRCLAASLRLANRRCAPSVRRAVVAGTLEAWLSSAGDHALRSELTFRTDPVLRPAWEWYRTAESLIGLLPPPSAFPSAVEILSRLARRSTILAVSAETEATALSMWSSAGLGSLCSRVAGRERGDMALYLSRACAGGYGSVPITVIGSNHSSLSAARSVEARFLPILPGRENECWTEIGRNCLSQQNLEEEAGPAEGDREAISESSIPAGPLVFPDTGTLLLEFLESVGAHPLR